MDSSPKLTGETLIVHHIPLVHCQVPDRQCCSVSKRTNPFCQPELGITQTSALPDRDLSQTDSLAYSSFLQASETLAEASDNKEGKARDLIVHSVSNQHNPFLLNEGEDLSIFGDNLGQKSFHLHNSLVAGKPPFHLHELALPPFHLHDSNHVVKSWNMVSRSGVVDGQEDKISSDDVQKRNNANQCHQASERMELDECSCHCGSSSSFSFDGGDQEWNQNMGESLRNQDALHRRTCSCSSSELQHCHCYSSSSQSEVIDQQMGYISDSSCNSSNGVLVNFSALYNKMNGHSRSNLNSANLSCDSSFCSHSDTGAFYLDLHSSPTESKMSCESHHPESSGKVCGCQHSSSPVLDANCNSYHLHCEPCTSESSDLTACFQSQARLVVATQNYYKLVTCDLSSQSSPSPAGSSITSCSEDHTKGSPAQPTEYYLFRRPDLRQEERNVECSEEEAKGEAAQNMTEGQVYVNVSPPNLNTSWQRSRSYDQNLDRSPSSRLGSLERMVSCPIKLSESPAIAIQSSPPKQVTSFAELAKGRKKNGTSPPLRSSGDSSLEFSPIPETQWDCPTFLEERACRSQSLLPMPFVHSLNRSCKDFCLNHAFGDSQALCSTKGSGSSETVPSGHGEGGGTDCKPVVRYSKDQRPTTLPIQPFVFQHHFSKPPKAHALRSHFASSLSQLYSLSSNWPASQQISSSSQSSALAASAEQSVAAGSQAHSTLLTQCSVDGAASCNDGCIKKPAPETTRPPPLGSYSPVRCNVPFFQSVDSSSSSTTERAGESQPPRSRSCPISASLLPMRSSPAISATQPSQATKADALRQKENPKPVPKKEASLEPSPPLSEYRLHSGSFLPLSVDGMPVSRVGGHADPHWRSSSETSSSGPLSSMGIWPLNANHLSPQALKWREYRQRNPLGLDHLSGLPGLAGSLDRRQQEPQLNRGNPIFELPGTLNTSYFHCKLNGRCLAQSWGINQMEIKHMKDLLQKSPLENRDHLRGQAEGQSMRQHQLTYIDIFPDYFSLAEKPPTEFCLSPDGNTESISIDLLQKKGLVKAINTAVDLIVAHFGTSRDPGVKAKLGNSSVSPNVGHLILKYLCPAVRDILSDGLKAYVLDMIIGQRRNIPWSMVEASTQLGPSTKLLHSLYSKISQYTELTNHTMRFNAFIFGLLNIRSLEFWFNHLFNHEDIILAHYQPVGFLCLSHSVCQPLFEELLLLLQPLSLLPFNLDLLFEHHLMQMSKEQQQQKELLRVKQDLLLSTHSTLQLMRMRGSSEDPYDCSTAPEACKVGARDDDISPGYSPQQAASERVKGVGASCGDGNREEEQRKVRESTWEGKKDKQAGWWYQLMQSSQIYIEGSAEGSKFIRYEKKAAALNAVPRSAETRKAPSPREGVVEGAEAEGTLEERPKAASKPSPEAVEEPLEKPQQVLVGEEVKEWSWPFWMGSPPDSVLTELKHSKEKETGTQQRVGVAVAAPQEESSISASKGSQPIKWGHLFGSRKVQKEPRQPNRLPSSWLSLDKSMFQLVAQMVGASMWQEAAPELEPPQPEPPEVPPKAWPAWGLSAHSPCEVKALCHHIATEAGQLSFNKGDILQVISKVDGDWLQCSLGSEKGLVPIMYVTHPEDEDY